MPMSPSRWNEITASQFTWEQDALNYIRQSLPDIDPYRAWTNFEFIASDGSINEVDALIITRAGFFLVEIKSQPGRLSGDAGTWMWRTPQGKVITQDNPLLLANRKAKKLISLIQTQKAMQKVRRPFLEALVFCSAQDLTWDLKGHGDMHVCFRRKQGAGPSSVPDVINALQNRRAPGLKPDVPFINTPTARAIGRALDAIGIRQSQKMRRVGDYLLGKLLFQCPKDAYQDFEAVHTSLKNVQKRVRIYNTAKTVSDHHRRMIQKAAEREYNLHSAFAHEGVLKAEHFTLHELGPALIYPYEPDGMRLDHYLRQFHARLSIDVRMALVRQIAEVVQYAHGKGIVHRALSPLCIYVHDGQTPRPRIKIANWHTGRRVGAQPTSSDAVTLHPEQLVADRSLLYMAPEALRDPHAIEMYMDIFSLGAIAHHIFSGHPPAASLVDLSEQLQAHRGLDIALIMDGVGPELRDLIMGATDPEVSNRWDAVDDFLEQLQAVEDELTQPDDFAANPLDAVVGDTLPGGFEVIERLGKGGSATVFFVRRNGQERVLKLANQPDINDRLRAEYALLKQIRHPLVVKAYDEHQIGPLYGFRMQRAGDATLAQRLRQEGPLQLEFLQRFGADLLAIIAYLEEIGVHHRDLKPENMGIGPVAAKGKLRLILFDFSLASGSLDQIRAGSLQYHDPFITQRRPVRWDAYAERFCAAMILYQMAVGSLPKWGDGKSAPAMLDCEATLASDAFDPHLRAPMTAFFETAFKRDYKARFDNAEEMRIAWDRIFYQAPQPSAPSDHAPHPTKAVDNAALDDQLAALGLSPQALNALERINVTTVADLLSAPLNTVRYLKGAGQRTRKEIVSLCHNLHRTFPDFGALSPRGELSPQDASVETVVGLLAPAGSSDARTVLHAFLGLTSQPQDPLWPGLQTAARALKRQTDDVRGIWMRARERWRRLPAITDLRNHIHDVTAKHGGLISAPDLAAAVLTLRGSALEEPRRTQCALALCRAAIHAEQGNRNNRFGLYRLDNGGVLVLFRDDWGLYAQQLGDAADQLASREPLPSPAQAVRALRDVAPPQDLPAVPPENNLLKIAVYASQKAALSTRLEIYPQHMSALRMLRLSQGALAGARELSVHELHQRVQGRYPQGQKLPSRPELDALLERAGLDMVWRPQAADGQGAFGYQYGAWLDDTTGSSTGPSAAPGGPRVTPEMADARIFDRKLQRAHAEGAFLVLTSAGRYLKRARTALLNRFDLKPIDLDRVMLPLLKQMAAHKQVKWEVVLKADAAPQTSRDWRNLNLLVGMCMPALEKKLSHSDQTILLTHIGLLARYNQMQILENLRDRVGVSGSALEGLWVLIPADQAGGRPCVDGTPIPLLGSGQYAAVPKLWWQQFESQGTQGDSGWRDVTQY